MTTEVDVVVIGSGPAGLRAAYTVAADGRTCVAIDRMGPGGLLMNLDHLHDLPPDIAAMGTSGPELIAALTEAAMSAGAEIAIDDVARVEPEASGWSVVAGEQRYRAEAVILATGLTPGTTGLADEAAFEGRGLSRCAHCDGPLYASRAVVVYGRDRWAVTEAATLAQHATDVMLVLSPVSDLASVPEPHALPAGVRSMEGRITQLGGSGSLESVHVLTSEPAALVVAAAGLFLYSNRRPETSLIDPALLTAPSLFLAGDVAGGDQSISQAIADGRRAGQNALEWLSGSSKV